MAKTSTSSSTSKAQAAEEPPLAKEYETYKAHLQRLAHEEGKFVLIHHADVAGVYATYEDALAAGYEKFKLKPFLVKQITAAENPVYLRS